MQLPALLRELPDNVQISGPHSGATLERKGPCHLFYKHGGVDYQDTLPAHLLAQKWPGGDPPPTLMDRTSSKHVTFVLPANGGTIATLWFCKEADFQAIWEAQDVLPMEEIHLHYVRRWQIRTQPCPPIAAPISYLWTTGAGLLYTTDAAHHAWRLPDNTGLAGYAVESPLTIPVLALQGIVSTLDMTACLVEPCSQLALSYQDISRLWCVAGTGSGSTPTRLYQSNDNGAHWTQLTLPVLSGTFAMVMGVAVDVCENLYVTVAHGPGYGNALSVLSAAKPYTSWRVTLLTDLTASTWGGYARTHTNEDGNITGAPIACDPLLPGRVIVGACWATPTWGWSALYVSGNGLAATPTYAVNSIGGEADDLQTQQYLSLDAHQGRWQGAWSQTSAVLWRLSGDFTGAGFALDQWPNHGHNAFWNLLTYRANLRIDRRSGYAGALFGARLVDATYGELAFAEVCDPDGPTLIKHVLYRDYLQTWNEFNDDGSRALAAPGGGSLAASTKQVPSTRSLTTGGGTFPIAVGDAAHSEVVPTLDYSGERGCVAAALAPLPDGSANAVQVFTFASGLTTDEAVTIATPTVTDTATPTPHAVDVATLAVPWAIRARDNLLTTPAVPGTLPATAPTITAPADGDTNVDTQTAVMTWTAVAGATVTHYEVEGCQSTSFAAGTLGLHASADATSSPLYTALVGTATGPDWYLRVRAMSHATPGPWSTPIHITVGYSAPPMFIPPMATDGVTVHLGHLPAIGEAYDVTFYLGAPPAGVTVTRVQWRTLLDQLNNTTSQVDLTTDPVASFDLGMRVFAGTQTIPYRVAWSGPLGIGSYSPWHTITIIAP